MRDGILAALSTPALGPALAAFCLGVALGWLIWGGVRRRPDGDAGAPDLAELQSQIRTARDELQERDGELDQFTAQLAELDGAIKRAHERLKDVLKALRGAPRD